MTRGRFTIADCDISIDKQPKTVQSKYNTAEYDMRIIGADNTGRVYPIPKADAERMAKKISAFKRVMKAEMLESARKYKAGKR